MLTKKLIGVIGGRDADDETLQRAYDVGRAIAARGYGLVCGGLGGVMEAACRGANEMGGVTVGVLPGDDPESANEYVDVRVATGMGIARNVIIVQSASAVVAIAGGAGTLSEIRFAHKTALLGSFSHRSPCSASGG
jgi:uncharacterized protein (TIGR00725 family)